MPDNNCRANHKLPYLKANFLNRGKGNIQCLSGYISFLLIKSPHFQSMNQANINHIFIQYLRYYQRVQKQFYFSNSIPVQYLQGCNNMTSAVQIVKDFFCGCVSGWAQVFCMLPLENIKIKVVSKPEEYNQGYLHAFKKTVAEEGLMSFYKGMLMPLIGVGAQVSLQFGTVETLKKIIRTKFAEKDGSLHWKYSVLSGALSGIPSAIVVTVLDHSRFRVALRKEQGQGSVRTAIRIYQQYGLSKLYLGFNCTMLRQSFLGVYFGSYDFFNRWFKKDGEVSKMGSFLSGGLAGAFTWTVMYPVDFVKTRIQSDSLQNPQYRNSIDCFEKQFSKGYRVIYNGFGIMIFRAFFVNAVGFLAFEMAKKMVYRQ